jgi:hypothetical protein
LDDGDLFDPGCVNRGSNSEAPGGVPPHTARRCRVLRGRFYKEVAEVAEEDKGKQKKAVTEEAARRCGGSMIELGGRLESSDGWVWSRKPLE